MKFRSALDYIRFFEKIPDENFTVGSCLGKATCALGHVGNLDGLADYNHPLNKFLGPLSLHTFESLGRIVAVNDGLYFGDDVNYTELGDTPKERVMNALLLKAAGVWKELFDEKR